jgi:hypothetical protein
MAVLEGRSHNEAMVYVVLRDCPACGEQIRAITDELEVRDGAVLTEYTAVCQRCGNTDSYVFRLPEDDPRSGTDGVDYGRAEASKIVDAGEWLGFADRVATGGPVESAGLTPEERADAALSLTAAAAAVREVLKFIPPGEDRVPLAAIWTDRGKAEFAREPGRMRRARMEVLEAAYRESAARLTGDRPIDPR